MSFEDLPLNEREILDGVKPWVECESPSWDGASVSRMVALAADELRGDGASIRTIQGKDGWGDCVFADFDPSNSAPGILILGHLDTVHPIGALEHDLQWREEAGRCYGPGLFDMKSGNYLALEAYRKLRAAALLHLPIRFLFTSDEESGSAANRNLIETMARAQKYVLVPEGAQPNGNIVSGRFPTRRLRVWTYGKPSHALLQKGEGASALSAMARVVLEIEALNCDEYSVTVTNMNSGRAVSTVPLEAYAEVICTAKSQEALEKAIADINGLATRIPGCDIETAIKTARPHWVPGAEDKALWETASGVAGKLGFPLDCEMLFGGSDGNFTGAIGVPTLDGLGPIGADAHQLTEHILVDSLVPRAKLLAGLMTILR